MMLSIGFVILFAICGVSVSEVVFRDHKFINRIWLGLAIGLLMITWLPSLFALFIGFTLSAQLLAAVTAFLTGTASFIFTLITAKRRKNRYCFDRNDWVSILCLLPITLIFVVLLHTHILCRHSDGSLWVGQVTYGDLAMHLGFITSIAEQTVFPPQYSIFPGHALNYPFLCETSGASLFQLGASVRDAYIISALYACILVVFGVYAFFKQWLKRNPRALFATFLFFFGSGLGFLYFLDLSKSGGLLPSLLNEHQTVSQLLLDGFYLTPTNIPDLGLRWVNPIVDMLIPQRATLFGWAFLFPCLYLLHGYTFEQKKANVFPLAVFAGLLPMIHTHSFLALGIISAVYCITDLISVRFERKRLIHWAIYAVVACVLAAPQLFMFTFRQTSESSLVRLHLNWANEKDSYLWFYIKNLGLIFLLMPFAFLLLPKRDKKIYSGAIAVWLIAEFIEFQPNNYDNNKLLFIWFAFTCGLTAKFMSVILRRIVHRIRKKSKAIERRSAYRIAIGVVTGSLLCYFLYKLTADSEGGFLLRPGTALTLFFSAGLILTLCIAAFINDKKATNVRIVWIAPMVSSLWLIGILIFVWLRQYRQYSFELSKVFAILTLCLFACSLIIFLLLRIREMLAGQVGIKSAWNGAALAGAGFIILFTLFASSTMTIIRETKSEYQVYTKSEAELADQIRNVTEPDTVILANSYHWNAVTPLTGRSIVTGTGTFLYYHGIDTTERENDVTLMFEDPAEYADLFRKYGVGYVLVTNAERMNYTIDYEYFNAHGTIVAQTDAGLLYKLNP